MRGESTQETHVEHEKLLERLSQLKGFLWNNAVAVALAVAFVVVAVVGVRHYLDLRRAEMQEAWLTLSLLPDTAQLVMVPDEEASNIRAEAIAAAREVVETVRNRQLRPWALPRLGALQADQGEWEEALVTYRRLLTAHSGSPAAEMARSAYAAVLEQSGAYGEAAAVYEELAAKQRRLFLLDAGRCRELNLEPDRAADNYRQILDSDLPERVRDMARVRLAAVERADLLTLPPEPEEPPEPLIEDPADIEAPPELPPLDFLPEPGEPPPALPGE